jgi:hypothetical protein
MPQFVFSAVERLGTFESDSTGFVLRLYGTAMLA